MRFACVLCAPSAVSEPSRGASKAPGGSSKPGCALGTGVAVVWGDTNPMERLTLTLLGGFQARQGSGRALVLPGKKAPSEPVLCTRRIKRRSWLASERRVKWDAKDWFLR